MILKAFASQDCIVKRLLFHIMVMELYNIGVSLLLSSQEVGGKHIGCPVTLLQGKNLRAPEGVDLRFRRINRKILFKLFGKPL